VKGYNLKHKQSKKGKKGKEESVEDKLPDIDLSKDERLGRCLHLLCLRLILQIPSTRGIFVEFCYGVSVVPERYLQVLKIFFNLSH
jgi:hypothetical protein